MNQPITLDDLEPCRSAIDSLAGELKADALAALGVVKGRLLRPSLTFGWHAGVSYRESPRGAEAKFEAFCKDFTAIAKSIGIEHEPPTCIDGTFESLRLEPLTYMYTLDSNGVRRTVEAISPLCWVVCYEGFEPARLREAVRKKSSELQLVRAFIMHTLAVHYLLACDPALKKLFEMVRLPVRTVKLPEFSELPLTCICAPAGSVRPPDEVILKLIALTGVTRITEVLDLEAWSSLRDPMAERFQRYAQPCLGPAGAPDVEPNSKSMHLLVPGAAGL